MPTYRMKTTGVPQGRPHYGDQPGQGITPGGGAWMPAPALTPEQAYGGEVVVLGHRGMIARSADPQMANFLPTTQVPSRWAPPVAGNVLVPVLTAEDFPAGVTRGWQGRPVHVPVPIAPPNGLAISRAMQIGTGPHGRRARTGIAGPTVKSAPKFLLRGGGTTS